MLWCPCSLNGPARSELLACNRNMLQTTAAVVRTYVRNCCLLSSFSPPCSLIIAAQKKRMTTAATTMYCCCILEVRKKKWAVRTYTALIGRHWYQGIYIRTKGKQYMVHGIYSAVSSSTGPLVRNRHAGPQGWCLIEEGVSILISV